MAFFWGRFDPIEGPIEGDIKKLYRRRECDSEFKNKSNLIAYLSKNNANNTDNAGAMGNYIFHKGENQVYDSLTEDERIENGIPSRYLLFTASFPQIIFSCFWVGNQNLYKITK